MSIESPTVRRSLFVVVVCALAGRAAAAPKTDLVMVWAPGLDPAPVAKVATDLGAALIVLHRDLPSAEPAAAMLRAAIAAYDSADVDRAWRELERLRNAIDRSGAAGLTAGQLSDVFLYRAMLLAQRDDAATWDEVVTAVVVDPARVLDQVRFPPNLLEQVSRARSQVLQRPRATLAVTEAAGCRLVLDGRTFDPAVPQLIGDHWLRVECLDRAPWGARITLTEPAIQIAARGEPFAAPRDDELLVQARATSARTFVIAEVRAGVGSARLMTADGRERARRSVAVAGDLSPLAAAIREVSRDEATGEPRPWYRSRWAWVAGAAVLAAGIAIPITAAIVGDNPPTDATVGGPPKGKL